MQTASLLGRILEGSVGEAAFFSGYGARRGTAQRPQVAGPRPSRTEPAGGGRAFRSLQVQGDALGGFEWVTLFRCGAL